MVGFTCGHCGAFVPPLDGVPRNCCPECWWSRHDTFGTDDLPPCGAMMRGTRRGDDVVNVCTGCGMAVRLPTDEQMYRQGKAGRDYLARQAVAAGLRIMPPPGEAGPVSWDGGPLAVSPSGRVGVAVDR